MEKLISAKNEQLSKLKGQFDEILTPISGELANEEKTLKDSQNNYENECKQLAELQKKYKELEKMKKKQDSMGIPAGRGAAPGGKGSSGRGATLKR